VTAIRDLTFAEILRKASVYNQLVRWSATRYLPYLLREVDGKSRILDVGCGSSTILPAGFQVTRCDLNPDHLPDLECSALELTVENGSFDAVVHSWVLEHLEDPVRALDECYRVLKPGGVLYLTTNMAWHLHESPRDFFRFTEYGLRSLLKESHWEILFLEATLGFWGTVTQLISYRVATVLTSLRLEYLHPVFTVPLQLVGVLAEKVSRDRSLCAGYCVLARKLKVYGD